VVVRFRMGEREHVMAVLDQRSRGKPRSASMPHRRRGDTRRYARRRRSRRVDFLEPDRDMVDEMAHVHRQRAFSRPS